MSFQSGTQNTTTAQQLIAFWTHTIDMYAYQFYEHNSTMGGVCSPITNTVSEITGITSEKALMGAIRSGLKHSIAALPNDVRTSIEAYFEKKVRMIHDMCSQPF